MQLLIGENTLKSVENPEKYSIRMVDRVAVKGKALAVRLYEVLDAEEPHRKAKKETTRELLNQAIGHYFSRDFAAALELFSQGLENDPEDAVFEIFATRSQRYLEHPPADNWKGYESLVSK